MNIQTFIRAKWVFLLALMGLITWYQATGSVLENSPAQGGTARRFPSWQHTNPGGGGVFNAIGAGPTGLILAASDFKFGGAG